MLAERGAKLIRQSQGEIPAVRRPRAWLFAFTHDTHDPADGRVLTRSADRAPTA
jgi:hypothetical protein